MTIDEQFTQLTDALNQLTAAIKQTMPPASSEAVKPEAVKAEAVEPEAVKPETVKPEAVKAEAVKAEAVEAEAVEAAPVEAADSPAPAENAGKCPSQTPAPAPAEASQRPLEQKPTDKPADSAKAELTAEEKVLASAKAKALPDEVTALRTRYRRFVMQRASGDRTKLAALSKKLWGREGGRFETATADELEYVRKSLDAMERGE